MFNSENLDVRRKAIDFADLVYNQTRGFPADERFGLTNQTRRAAVSISSSIAEGSSRMSETDFPRLLEIATGSVFEVASQSFIGGRQGFLNEQNFRAMDAAAGKTAACSADYENRSSRRKVVRVILEPPTINFQL